MSLKYGVTGSSFKLKVKNLVCCCIPSSSVEQARVSSPYISTESYNKGVACGTLWYRLVTSLLFLFAHVDLQ